MSEIKDALAGLRNVKIPWWARLMGWWNARKLRRVAIAEKQRRRHETKHVATVFVWFEMVTSDDLATIWYICKENGEGVRSYEFGTERATLRYTEKNNKEYARVIAPWLNKGYTNEALANYAKGTVRRPTDHDTK